MPRESATDPETEAAVEVPRVGARKKQRSTRKGLEALKEEEDVQIWRWRGPDVCK
jgi:hypothetical protein